MSGNLDAEEIAKFDSLAGAWWDPEGPGRPLHDINPARFAYVTRRSELTDRQVLDVGCGGGILSESLARAGAHVTAVDGSHELIETARMHARMGGLEIDYRNCTADDLPGSHEARFDIITCMELLEHVPDPGALIATCASLLRPGGILFVSTINRTALAYGMAVVGAEYVMRLLPRGTHDYARFIRPAELARMMRAAGLTPSDVTGMRYNPFTHRATLCPSPAVNYLACANKPQ
ncbi:MAG: bifunctional 2-polyprenyl-6-hydroxyphenol methylase/3-demethylubiquinol 3-O-methyltransferase UbiG [Gammaproteobacteria bacterium]|nr:bifunctional 2-polyprenyl-6-hydroxyphenol methylase/3-demethylubiquinol 3-O-methyltransferase UbiG [Gammaproteobacteria bacterium]